MLVTSPEEPKPQPSSTAPIYRWPTLTYTDFKNAYLSNCSVFMQLGLPGRHYWLAALNTFTLILLSRLSLHSLSFLLEHSSGSTKHSTQATIHEVS